MEEILSSEPSFRDGIEEARFAYLDKFSMIRVYRIMWQTLLFSGTAGLFLIWTLSMLWHLRWVRRLPGLETFTEADLARISSREMPVRCSVVIAARDEEARIEQSVRSVLAQRGIELEIIVVDDRSADRTSQILQKLSNEDARVRVKRVDVLPQGWLGKCHACHVGASAATGEWILFADADVWLKPDVILRTLCTAEREGADHITLAPNLSPGDVGRKASHLLFAISLANWFSGVNRDRQKSFMGIGAFNFVRAATYRQSGGYDKLRLTVVDDMKLGLLLRRAGGRTRAFLGGDDVECAWGATAWSTVKLMEKNYFAALDYRLSLVIAGTIFMISVSALLLFALLSGTPLGIIAALSPLLIILPGIILARRLHYPLICAFCMPFMLPLFLYALLNSTFVTLRQGGIRWRETFYSLGELRAGNFR